MKGLKTGGRQIGSLNKTTNEVRKLAQEYGQEAIEVLVNIMRTAAVSYTHLTLPTSDLV